MVHNILFFLFLVQNYSDERERFFVRGFCYFDFLYNIKYIAFGNEPTDKKHSVLACAQYSVHVVFC